jgi:diguanylate cyclase (GGDEF)-like protein
MLDIDHFKTINDTHGHAGGDCVLRELVTRIANEIRPVDLLGRLGGEEFAILLPDTDIAGAEHLAERLRWSLADSPIDSNGTPVAVTASLGVAALRDGEDLESILARADTALYQAKNGGRNRVVRAEK